MHSRYFTPHSRRVTQQCTRYRRNAYNRRIDMQLSDRQMRLLFNMRCFYCGGDSGDSGLVGIDRVVNRGDYTPDNVVPCCARCNTMKGTLHVNNFIQQCTRVARHVNNNTMNNDYQKILTVIMSGSTASTKRLHDFNKSDSAENSNNTAPASDSVKSRPTVPSENTVC